MRVAVVGCLLAGCGRLGFGLGADVLGDDPAIDGALDARADTSSPGGIERTQASVVVFNTGAQTVSLQSPTAPGTLLVMAFAGNDLSSLGLPSGWQIAVQASTNGACAVTIAYLPDNPGGITSVMYTQPTFQPTDAQLTEWTGVATTSPLDATGTKSGMSSLTQSVQTSTATTASDELAIDAFCEDVAAPTYTPQAGWNNLGFASNGSAEPSFTSEYKLVTSPGTVGETVTSNFAAKYSGAIATFRPQ